MKKFLPHLKYLIFTLVFIVAGFGLSQHASATGGTYSYDCSIGSGGGNVATTVDMTPGGPFAVNAQTPFTATAQITSTCNTRAMSLSFDNDGVQVVLFHDVSVSPGNPYPIPEAFKLFNAPGPAGSYEVRFTTLVDEPIKSAGLPNAYITLDTPCAGGGGTIYSYSTIHAKTGDEIVLNLSFSGMLRWSGIDDRRNAGMSFSVGNPSIANAAADSPYVSHGAPDFSDTNSFSLSKSVTFTMTGNTMSILTEAVTRNSTHSMSNATYTIVSVNGMFSGSTGAACVGNSQGI